MKRIVRRLPIVALALLALSCASSNKLNRQSEDLLQAGQNQKAYQKARRALDKDPANDRARESMRRAAERIVADWQRRAMNLADVDTLAAAKQCVELAEFRSELDRYRVDLPRDTAFARRERLFRETVAGDFYALGMGNLRDHRPKQAWAQLSEAAHFMPGYRDVPAQIDRAYQAALTRVAVLPFANQTDVPGLSKAVEDRIYHELAGQFAPPRFQFTRLIGRDDVYAQLTVAQAEGLTPDEAASLGRRLGAARVVAGRVFALRSSTNSEIFHHTIFHKVTEKLYDRTRVRYEEADFHAVYRQRDVTVRYELQVRDTDGDSALAQRADQLAIAARVVFTDFPSAGDCADYCLLPPDVKKADPEAAKKAEEEWTSHFGDWTLPALLETARKGKEREHYRSEYRGDFRGGAGKRPVYLGELPGDDDMALVALDGLWEPVRDALHDFDDR